MTRQKETAERLGELSGQGKAKGFISRNYNILNAVDAALMMVSFVLGLVAGVLL